MLTILTILPLCRYADLRGFATRMLCRFIRADVFQVLEKDELAHTLTENSVLAKCQHPFLTELRYSFQVRSAASASAVQWPLGADQLLISRRRRLSARSSGAPGATVQPPVNALVLPFLTRVHVACVSCTAPVHARPRGVQTMELLCFVLEYVNGGEIFFHLSNDKRFSEDRTRFYIAEISLAVTYLHDAGIICRDLDTSSPHTHIPTLDALDTVEFAAATSIAAYAGLGDGSGADSR